MELQGLRAVAIMMVAVFHYLVRWDSQTTGGKSLYPYSDLPETIRLIVAQGRLGVELFFLISGFVIALTLENSGSWKEFWIKRVSRLWPPLVICLPLIWLVLQFCPPVEGSSKSFLGLIFSLTLISPSAVGLSGLGQTTGVLWTLWVELQFYMLASVVFFSTRKFLRNITIGGSALWVLFIFSCTRLSPSWVSDVASAFNLGHYIWWFIAGACAFKLRKNFQQPKVMALYAVCLALSFTCLGAIRLNQDSGTILENTDFGALAGNILILVMFTLVAIGQRRIFMANPVLAVVGNSSYEFYLLHEALGLCLLQFANRLSPIDTYAFSLIPVLLVLLTANLIYRFWSVRATKWTRQRLSNLPPSLST